MISIIHKYILQEFAKYFCIVQLVVICIFVVVDYLGGINRFITSGISFLRAFTFVFLRIPFFFTQLIPVIIILSIIITFGLMNKNNEILVLKSSGVNLFYLIKPLIITGLILTVTLFILTETVVPIATESANTIKLVEIKKENFSTSKEKNIWIKGDNVISHIKFYNPIKQIAFGIAVSYYDNNFKLTDRIDAQKGVYKNGKWIFYQILQQMIDKKNGERVIKFYDKKEILSPFTLDDLKGVVKKSDEMSIKELSKFIERVEAEGYDATVYKVDFQSKLAFPFICVIMCIAGAGIAMKSYLKGRIPLSVSYGIGFAFFYWVFYSFCIALGHGEILLYWVAAWMPNIVFFLISCSIIMSDEL